MAYALLSREKRAGSLSTKVRKQKASPVHVLDSWPGFDGASFVSPPTRSVSPLVLTKLKIGTPNDQYEREADRVADAVMRMSSGSVTGSAVEESGPGGVRRLCGQPEEKLRRLQSEEEVQLHPIEEQRGLPQTGANCEGTSTEPASVHNSNAWLLKGNGQSLPRPIRSFFEPRFGRDLSQVRVHADVEASRSASLLRARAFTMGNRIAFGAGMYAPQTAFGRRLLAHELTHVVQQESIPGLPVLQREESPPDFRDCTSAITGIPNPNERLENGRQRARGYVGAAIRALNSAPAAGSTYATALNRHFVNPTAAQRASIQKTYRQIMNRLVVSNFICNSQNICQGEQAFWIASDDLIHVCRPFWSLSITCRAIVLIHEAHHDIAGGGEGVGYRGDPSYPAGNNPPPGGQTTAMRMNTPDAYAFFAAHIWRDTDTSSTCF